MKPAGFSLLELLIVIAIIGILAALGVSGYTRWRASSSVMAGAQEFAQAVDNTRSGAKRANACWQVRLTGNTAGTTGYEVRQFSTPTCTGTATATRAFTLPAGTQIKLGTGGSNDVNFTPPYGTTDAAVNDYEVSWVNTPDVKRTLRISSVMGRVIVQ